ncbi:MAG: hypothetical protein HQM04_06455 [Magnetococcales bacterium]|nr:hypothetical protein [Magnetococcales bacterium]MBF0114669.1 hypothetical protein [Magnetococcales bacterium]
MSGRTAGSGLAQDGQWDAEGSLGRWQAEGDGLLLGSRDESRHDTRAIGKMARMNPAWREFK